MKKRMLLGLLMIAIVAVMLYLDYFIAQGKWQLAGLPLALLVGLLIVPAFFELRRLVLATGAGLLDFTGLVGTTVIALYPFWWRFIGGSAAGAAFAFVGLVVMAMFAEQIIRFRIEGAVGRLTATSLVLLYLGVGGAVILAIRMEMGLGKLLLFLAAVKFTDIGAYFTGSAIGRHKLVGWLSPGKSWEGLLGGLVAGALVGGLISLLMPDMTFRQGVAFGAVVGAAGQFADFCESLLKRSARVKDSGAVVPEFGGVLDILDSLLLSAPLAYFILRLYSGG